jgi:hypothetical protein
MRGSSNVQLLGLQVLWHKFLSLEKHTEYLLQTLSIWILFLSTSFQDGENLKKYFCENLSAQIKNSTTVSEWKKHKDMFLSNMSIQTNWGSSKALQIPKWSNVCQFILSNNSKIHKKDSSKMWVFKSTRACERPYSNPNDQTCVILYQGQLNSRVLFKLWPFQAHELNPRNDYPIECPVSKVH